MDKLKSMQVFVRLVDVNGFSKAADALNLSRGAVTRHVQDLEAWLGTTLIHRTTRKMQITTSGAEFYEQACRILGEMLEVEAMIHHFAHSPRGTLRLHTSAWLARWLVVPVLADFYAAHPGVSLSLSLGDEDVDPIDNGFDCVLCTGSLQDSSNIARALGELDQVIVASTDYLQARGVPASAAERDQHTFIASQSRGRRVAGRHHTALVINDLDAAMQACLEGVGIATVPRILAQPHLVADRLAEIASRDPVDRLPVFAVLPPGKRISPLARAFTQWIAASFPTPTPLPSFPTMPKGSTSLRHHHDAAMRQATMAAA